MFWFSLILLYFPFLFARSQFIHSFNSIHSLILIIIHHFNKANNQSSLIRISTDSTMWAMRSAWFFSFRRKKNWKIRNGNKNNLLEKEKKWYRDRIVSECLLEIIKNWRNFFFFDFFLGQELWSFKLHLFSY